jgi:hypothetical protein
MNSTNIWPLVVFIVFVVVVLPTLNSPLDLILLAVAAVLMGIALGVTSKKAST